MEKLISIPDLFKKSFLLYKSRFWTMLLLGLTGWLASIIIFAAFGSVGIAALFLGEGFATFNLLTVLLFLVGLLLFIVVALWVRVALVFTLKEEYAKAGVKDLLLAVYGKLVSYYWISFLRGVIVLLGFILFIVPGIIFGIWFSLTEYAFVFEGTKGMSAIHRSRELTKGYWWPILGRLLLLGIMAMIISSISKFGFFINSLFTMPFGIVYLYVVYEDLKRIKGTTN